MRQLRGLGWLPFAMFAAGCGGGTDSLGQTGETPDNLPSAGGASANMGLGGNGHGGTHAGGTSANGGASQGGAGEAHGGFSTGGKGAGAGAGFGQGAGAGFGQGAGAGFGQGAGAGFGQGAGAGFGQGAGAGFGQGAGAGFGQGAGAGFGQGASGGFGVGAGAGFGQGAGAGFGQGAGAGFGQGAGAGFGQGAGAGFGQGAGAGFGQGAGAGFGQGASGGLGGDGGSAQGANGGNGVGAGAGFGQGAGAGFGQGAGAGFGQGAGAGSSSIGGAGGSVCTPGTGFCEGNTAEACRPDGSGFDAEVCDISAGIFCDPPTGTCKNPCEAMLVGTNNIGCEYFPTVTSNGALFDQFSFAVSVVNTTLGAAHVTILRNGATVATATVVPGGLQTIKLPWVEELRHSYQGQSEMELEQALTSSVVKGGSYVLESDSPVTVFQFNPLEYEIPEPADGSCPDPHGTMACNSFTNDASLLFPHNALGTTYVVASHQSLSIQEGGEDFSYPGFVAITASENATQVQFTSAGFVRGGDGVSPMSPGDVQTFTLDKGDVVQLLTAPVDPSVLFGCEDAKFMSTLCQVPAPYDLTGSFITSSKPISVIGGHDCSFMPFDHFACDHLEQSIFPLDTWGNSALVTQPQSVVGSPKNDQTPDPTSVRIISGVDGNHIVLDPPIKGFSVPDLQKGKWVDLPLTSTDFVVTGSGPLLAVQYMLGGDLVDPADISKPTSKGDPSMSLAAPTAQYRRLYTFLAPDTYQFNFANIAAPKGAAITLDGASLSMAGAAAIGSSGYVVLRHALAGGAHTLQSDQPFGLVVYGYGTYTSYMYPGGLDLEHLGSASVSIDANRGLKTPGKRVKAAPRPGSDPGRRIGDKKPYRARSAGFPRLPGLFKPRFA